jgi:hypothetical protein
VINKKSVLAFAFFVLSNSAAQAHWSFNVGYNNPPGALVGGNFLNFWTNFALELGVGWITGNNKNGTSTAGVSGDGNLKYLFRAGKELRPYFQGGFGLESVTSVGNNTGVGLGTGGGFGGGGLFLQGHEVYAYGSYNISSSGPFWQGGLGFMF